MSFIQAAPVPVSASSVGTLDTVFQRPFFVPSDVDHVVIKLANRIWNAGVGNPVTCDVALYASDGTGKATGASFGTFLAQTVPGDGTFLVLPNTAIVRGPDGCVVVVMSFHAFDNVAQDQGSQWGWFQFNTTTVDPPPAPLGVAPIPVLDIRCEYTSTKRAVVVLGDSISVGVQATFFGACWNLIQQANDFAIGIEGVYNFGSLANFSDPAGNPFLYDEVSLSGSNVVIEVGVNDLGSGLATMQAQLMTLIAYLKAHGANRIYANTIAPSNSLFNATRAAYNAWLLANANALGLFNVADLALPQAQGGMADNGNPNALVPAFTTDGTHWTDVGQMQAAAMWTPIFLSNTPIPGPSPSPSNLGVFPGMLYPPYGNSIAPFTPEPLPFRPTPSGIGGTFVPPPTPPEVIPPPLAARTSKVAVPAAPVAPPRVIPPPASSGKETFTPAAPPATANTTSQNTVEVQASAGNFVVVERARKDINTLFRIVSPTPGSGQ